MVGKGFLHIFSRKKEDISSSLAEQYRVILANDAQRPANEQRMHEIMGIKREMLHDDWAEKILELDALSVEFDPNDSKKLTNFQTNPNSAAMRFWLSNRVSCSYLTPEDVAIYKAQLDIIAVRTEMNMDKKTFNMGGLSVLQSAASIAKMNLDSTTKGAFLRILNSISEEKTYRIQGGSPQPEEQKKGLFG